MEADVEYLLRQFEASCRLRGLSEPTWYFQNVMDLAENYHLLTRLILENSFSPINPTCSLTFMREWISCWTQVLFARLRLHRK